MTTTLNNLSLTTTYLTNDTLQTVNGEGLLVSHVRIPLFLQVLHLLSYIQFYMTSIDIKFDVSASFVLE